MKKNKKKPSDDEQQRKYVARLRAESCLDKRIPLGSTPPPTPETGQSAWEYYRGRPKGQYFELNPYRDKL